MLLARSTQQPLPDCATNIGSLFVALSNNRKSEIKRDSAAKAELTQKTRGRTLPNMLENIFMSETPCAQKKSNVRGDPLTAGARRNENNGQTGWFVNFL